MKISPNIIRPKFKDLKVGDRIQVKNRGFGYDKNMIKFNKKWVTISIINKEDEMIRFKEDKSIKIWGGANWIYWRFEIEI